MGCRAKRQKNKKPAAAQSAPGKPHVRDKKTSRREIPVPRGFLRKNGADYSVEYP
jgi:hypothetical protein